MKKLTCLLILGLFISFVSCSKGKDTTPTKTSVVKPIDQDFTTGDADLAYTAFNSYFYNPTAKLYYSTTKKDGVAAIWTQAIYLDMAINVYQRTKAPTQLNMINNLYQGNYNQYDGYNWNNTSVWFIYDDMMWWVMALARANQITGNATYLDKAKAGFDHVWAGSYDAANGGMYWDFQHSGKNSCINYPTVIAAMRLYTITGDTSYCNKAKAIYAWSKANLADASGKINDNKIGNNPAGGQDYTYNSGTAIGAALALYKVTNDATYLNDAKLYTDYVKNNLCTSGILPAEGDFNEQGVLKAIFAQYVMQLITEEGQTQYLSWIQTNVNTGWINRDATRNLTYRNYAVACPTGDIQSYEASSIVTFMQLCPPSSK
ncbi:glycoside hydrolase family 76 protein [Mucilaginibacter sp. FT3.2]|uniref:glycoside hydrolase family 76 protein n=1 Tax=Mucilaginibacter sp. FT3.2 TaxID=2723090 RepID=UPI001615AF13|nr:glycoside hydrolase family 76 protein [Mucilaginibacter sp. FT3.2]MBB6235258.1 putative alpha-1,6-mannanase (GH76 family) [Mucilaginibacter sp. FT3.2]